ncbi:ankyrin repeat domain-containing protein [Marinobacter salinexigens]|uniref:Ankyrin repeat domain-containing protein n=1 Tax=Marinobacter salinexigens TaxID=2919747 RepID=A0A5B0VMV8_9GAMM|nr:ankyrin repeat domain-containing protein [Marinobacter salinexigens]KAA1176070.1 ankyrin repeat domain-containing protein [Marinobacter salinexigens]
MINFFSRRKRTLTFVGVFLAIALTFFPMAYRTWAFGSDAWGLTVIALLDPEEVPWNPFNSDSLLIRPAAAYWLLTHSDWPYERCGRAMSAMEGCSQPLINFVGASLDLQDEDSIMRRRGYGLLKHFAARGEPVNGYYHGLAPVHEAVLYANVDYLRALLQLGADPYLTIESPKKDFHGFDAFEFAALLQSRNESVYQAVCKALTDWRRGL